MKAAAVIMLNPQPLRRDLVMQHHTGFIRRIKRQHLTLPFIRPKRKRGKKTKKKQACKNLYTHMMEERMKESQDTGERSLEILKAATVIAFTL